MDDVTIVPIRHKPDVDDDHRMADAGIFGEDDRVELIDGEIVDMAPIGQGHAAVVGGLTRALVMACGHQAIVWVRNPVRLDHLNEPQPDVADRSLRFDLTVKLPLYAHAGIAGLWVADGKRRALDAFRRPAGGGHAAVTTHCPGDHLALAAPGITARLDLAFG